MLWLWLFALARGNIPDAPPAPVVLTEEEAALVAAHEIAIRIEPSDTGGVTMGVMDVHATPEEIWKAVQDFHARVSEIRSLQSVEVYERSDVPETAGVRWEARTFGITIVFHLVYRFDRASGWCRYSLDTRHENTLKSVEGAYQLYPIEGGTRFVYRSVTDSGRRVPEWLRSWFAIGGLTEQMGGIRARAEAM